MFDVLIDLDEIDVLDDLNFKINIIAISKFVHLPLVIWVFSGRLLLLTDDDERSRFKFDWVLDDNDCFLCTSF